MNFPLPRSAREREWICAADCAWRLLSSTQRQGKKKRVLPTRYKNYTFLVLPVKNTAGNHDEHGRWIPGLCLLEEDVLSWRFWVIKHCTWSRQFYALQLCFASPSLLLDTHQQILGSVKMRKEEQRTASCSQCPSIPVLMLILGNRSIRRKGVLELIIKQYWGPWKPVRGIRQDHIQLDY